MEQRDYIFVTVQIANEVQRCKLQVAADFLMKQFEQLKICGFDVPDHLFDISGETAAKLRKKLHDIDQRIKEINADLLDAAVQMLQRISRSEDEVSKALAALFGKAAAHTPEEIQGARERRERGNPPGKKSDPPGRSAYLGTVAQSLQGEVKTLDHQQGFGLLYQALGQDICEPASLPRPHAHESVNPRRNLL